MRIICLLLYLPQFVGALQVETALFEVPVKLINEDIKTLQKKIFMFPLPASEIR